MVRRTSENIGQQIYFLQCRGVEGEPYKAKIQEDSINRYKKFKINLKNLKNVDSIRTIKNCITSKESNVSNIPLFKS